MPDPNSIQGPQEKTNKRKEKKRKGKKKNKSKGLEATNYYYIRLHVHM